MIIAWAVVAGALVFAVLCGVAELVDRQERRHWAEQDALPAVEPPPPFLYVAGHHDEPYDWEQDG